MAIPPCPLGPLDSLGGSLSSTPISLAVRRAIINTVFDLELTEDDFQTRNNGFEAYFDDWYEEQCEAAAGQVSVKTQRDILDVIACLQRRSASDSRAVIATILNQTDLRFGSGKRLGASIILAARLWLVISIGTFQHSQTPGRIVPWGEGALTDSIGEAFRVSSSCTDIVKFPKSFNAASVERVAGIKICWTSNLADHLSMEDDDTKVMMFHQMSFLELHRNPRSKIISSDLIDETRRTLGLLIPSNDKKSKKWFGRKRKELCLDPKAGSYGPLNATERQINNFVFWKDRLIVLKQIYDDSEPRSASLLMYDDRKKVQWYTFWIAALILLLTIVFGLIQSVSGIIQAWASTQSLHH